MLAGVCEKQRGVDIAVGSRCALEIWEDGTNANDDVTGFRRRFRHIIAVVESRKGVMMYGVGFGMWDDFYVSCGFDDETKLIGVW